MKMKLLSSAVLAAGLLSATAAVQAATLDFYGTITDGADVFAFTFVVNNAVDSSGVTLYTDSYMAINFDPWLAVWDSNGNRLDKSLTWNDISTTNYDAFIDMGQMADGTYTFTIGNAPNAPKGTNLSDGFLVTDPLGYWVPGKVGNNWHVVVTGVVPEPETWAMLLAGLGVMGVVARRRKQ